MWQATDWNRVNRTIALTVFLFLACFALACSSSKPSEADGRELFENKAKEEGLFRVVSFKKTNGIEEAQEHYTLEFEAQIECLSGGPIIPSVIQINDQCGIVCHGEGHTLKGSMTFQKTEKGWRVYKCTCKEFAQSRLGAL